MGKVIEGRKRLSCTQWLGYESGYIIFQMPMQILLMTAFPGCRLHVARKYTSFNMLPTKILVILPLTCYLHDVRDHTSF